ncbi:MAG: NEW3 domain-containing protein [Candidatus Helarchaeota archaeon]|nr:NEW3 domain-containing protein [Candidatus Helarchaeota archaeon]
MSKKLRCGMLLISIFILGSILPLLPVNNQTNENVTTNSNNILTNSFINVTNPSNFEILQGDTTNHTISWALTDINYSDYLGAYSFTTDADGGVPSGWNRAYHDSSTDGKVVADEAGHHKVLQMYDYNSGGSTVLEQNFGDQTAGTVEVWYYGVTGTGPDCSLQLCLTTASDASGVLLMLNFSYAQIGYVVGSKVNKVCDSANNQWHHLRIVFNCTSDTFNLWVDGTQRLTNAAFQFAQTSLTQVMIYTGSGSTGGYYCYLDAFDYSWAPGYYLNRNMDYPNMALTYAIFDDGIQKTMEQTWSNEITVDYNVTRSLGIGTHNISLVFNDRTGNMFHDDVEVTVIETSPPQILEVVQTPSLPDYQEPVNITAHITDNTQIQTVLIESNHTEVGDYLGAYSFTTDADGSVPSGWTRPYHNLNTDGKIIAEMAGHQKVLETYDYNSGGYTVLEQDFGNKTMGTVELWYYAVTGTGPDCCLQLCLHNYWGTSGVYLMLNFSYAQIGYVTYPAKVNKICDAANNQWHHLRIIFNCGSDTYDVWLDGTQRITNIPFQYPQANLTKVTVYTGLASTGGAYCYFDAFDYSWAPGYYLNRNMESPNFANYSMTMLSGSLNDGVWGYTFSDYPINQFISYRIFAQDVFGNWNVSDYNSFGVFDFTDPVILNVVQTPAVLTNWEPVKVTVHIQENLALESVLINSNYTDSWVDYPMTLLNGSLQDGFWEYTVSSYSYNESIWYRVVATDVVGRTTTTGYSQFGIFPIVSTYVPLDLDYEVDVGMAGDRRTDITFTFQNTGNTHLENINFTIQLPAGWTAKIVGHTVSQLAPGQNVTITFKVTVPKDIGEFLEVVVIEVDMRIAELGLDWPTQYIEVVVSGVKVWDLFIWLVIIVGSASAAVTTTYVYIHRRTPTIKISKGTLKGKTLTTLKTAISADFPGPYAVVSVELMERINNISGLTDEERQLLIEDVAPLDEEAAKKWIDAFEKSLMQ